MNVLVLTPLLFTLSYVGWAVIWGWLHITIRQGRQYAEQRTQVGTNSLYKQLNTGVFLAQNIICIASFWTNAPILLKVYDSPILQLTGLLLIGGATLWYYLGIRYLGRNYSPCYDAHRPFELVQSGPYRFVRHPMYGAKFVLAIALFVMSGSLWMLLTGIHLLVATIQALRHEEAYLQQSFPGYRDYQATTKALIPFLL